MASSIMLLKEATRRGQIDVLHNLLDENPLILVDHSLNSLSESLLHVATKFGHLSFVHELMKIDPDIAAETNKDDFRPLDIAVIMGNIEIVKEILSFNQDLCRLKGKDQKTALHYAVQKGRVDVIDELMCRCPGSIRRHGKTTLHIAVKSYRFDAFACIVKWLGRLKEESIFGVEDKNGNTVLHVTVSTKQHECIDLLLPENTTSIPTTIQVNAKNVDGLTPLDLLDIQDSYDDLKIQRKLTHALGSTKYTLPTISKQKKITSEPHENQSPTLQKIENWFEYFKFQAKRDSPSDTINTLLVVAALVATVCFQAGVSPPNDILEKNTPPNLSPPSLRPAGGAALVSESSIFGSHATSFLFLFANSLGLHASTCIIVYLTSCFPFQRELLIALYSMMFAYVFATSSVIKEMDTKERVMASVIVLVAFVLPFARGGYHGGQWHNYVGAGGAPDPPIFFCDVGGI